MGREIEPEALFVLLTQDCDILHHDYSAEPTIEIHIARPVDEENGNFFHAKNPRRLQFRIGQQLYEIKMHERCFAPRQCLLNHTPHQLVPDEDSIRTIVNWTANRYLRSAFPDAFNKRLDSAKKSMKKIEAALKRDGAVVTGIFLRVDPPEEIPPQENYEVIMRITAKEDTFEQPELVARAATFTETIRQEFDGIDGIEIIDYELVSEADFNLADLRETKRWDYDYLSYRAGTPDDTVPNAI